MKTIEEKKIDRFNFLKTLYEKKTGRGLQIYYASKIAKEIGLEEDEANLVVDYLEGEGLLKTHSDSGELISITHYGILEVEQALSEPANPTQHFLPINYIHVGQMNNSQIQQGTNNSSQKYTLTEGSLDNLRKFIEIFEYKVSELQFESDAIQKEVIAEVQTLKSQLSSPKPKEIVILESRKTLRNIFEGMTGSILASELLKLLIGS